MMKREPPIAELCRDLIAAVALFGVVLIGAWIVAMIDRPPLAFSDHQFAMLRRAAKALPPDQRADLHLVGHAREEK